MKEPKQTSYEHIIPREVLEETHFSALSVGVQRSIEEAFKALLLANKQHSFEPEKKPDDLRKEIHQIAEAISYKTFIKSFIKTFKSLVKGDERQSAEHHSDGDYDYIDFVMGGHWFRFRIKEDCLGNTNLEIGIDAHEFENDNELMDSFKKIIFILKKVDKQ